MIHLITLNPAIDEYIDVNNLRLGETAYRTNTRRVVGGKAVNVATVLKNLGVDATLVTTVDYKNSFVSNHLATFNSFLVEVDGIRTNLKINDNGKITEINDRGTGLTALAKMQFENYMNKCIDEGDIVLIAGNPHTDDEQFQFKLANIARLRGAKLFLDSNKITYQMLETLQPYFVKPNDEELTVLLEDNKSISDLTSFCSNVIVSHGGKGFTYYNSDFEKYESPITGTPINTVGAGDSLVAGFIYSESKNLELSDKLLVSKYTASATVYSGILASLDSIKQYDQYNIIK